jgi:hypothetical protein
MISKTYGMESTIRIWTLVSKRWRPAKDATYALALLRQLTIANRQPASKYNLLMIIEAADMLLPDEEISKMNIIDRKRIAVMQDWLSDPRFMVGGDSVVMISESRSSLHHRIARLPQILTVEAPLPDLETRKHFIHFMADQREDIRKLFMVGDGNHNTNNIAEQTSGLVNPCRKTAIAVR